jgi:uncharacterized protein
MRREHAWRVFANEFNDAQFEEKGTGEMAPSYIITPLGAKVNKMFIVGVLTDVENVSDDGGFVRAHVSDPTGVFTLYSGQYQPEITEKLSLIEVPAFVAITGKSRAYIPEDGDMLYASVRPQQIAVVSADIRDQWIVETCKLTKERISAMKEAIQMTDNYASELKKLGFSKTISSSVEQAVQQYDHVDIDRYVGMIKDALQYVTEGPVNITSPLIEKEESLEKTEQPTKERKPASSPIADEKDNEAEDTVLEVIRAVEGEEGASWDVITEKCEKQGLDVDTIEEALNALMEKGLIYEPVLGTIKTT